MQLDLLWQRRIGFFESSPRQQPGSQVILTLEQLRRLSSDVSRQESLALDVVTQRFRDRNCLVSPLRWGVASGHR
jgi:hypothetical protein